MKNAHCLISRENPTIRWWDSVQLPDGRVVYDMLEFTDEERSEWFMLEFSGERSRNSAATRLQARRIVVGPWFKKEAPSLDAYLRLKAAQWLEPRGDSAWSLPGKRTPTGELVDELRRWREALSRYAPILERMAVG